MPLFAPRFRLSVGTLVTHGKGGILSLNQDRGLLIMKNTVVLNTFGFGGRVPAGTVRLYHHKEATHRYRYYLNEVRRVRYQLTT